MFFHRSRRRRFPVAGAACFPSARAARRRGRRQPAPRSQLIPHRLAARPFLGSSRARCFSAGRNFSFAGFFLRGSVPFPINSLLSRRFFSVGELILSADSAASADRIGQRRARRNSAHNNKGQTTPSYFAPRFFSLLPSRKPAPRRGPGGATPLPGPQTCALAQRRAPFFRRELKKGQKVGGGWRYFFGAAARRPRGRW